MNTRRKAAPRNNERRRESNERSKGVAYSEGIRGVDAEFNFGALGDSIAFQLRRAAWAAHVSFADIKSSQAAIPRQYSVLHLIKINPGVGVNELANAIGVDQSTLVPTLDACEAEGWLKRERNPKDRRRLSMAVTAKGRAILSGFEKALVAHDEGLCEGITKQEQGMLMGVLRRIYSNAKSK